MFKKLRTGFLSVLIVFQSVVGTAAEVSEEAQSIILPSVQQLSPEAAQLAANANEAELLQSIEQMGEGSELDEPSYKEFLNSMLLLGSYFKLYWYKSLFFTSENCGEEAPVGSECSLVDEFMLDYTKNVIADNIVGGLITVGLVVARPLAMKLTDFLRPDGGKHLVISIPTYIVVFGMSTHGVIRGAYKANEVRSWSTAQKEAKLQDVIRRIAVLKGEVSAEELAALNRAYPGTDKIIEAGEKLIEAL